MHGEIARFRACNIARFFCVSFNRHISPSKHQFARAFPPETAPNGGFLPGGKVTRAEFATMLVKSMGLPPSTEKSDKNLLTFSDVKPADWHYELLRTAVKAGLIKGFTDGTFRPNDPVTREQVAVMVDRFWEK